MSAVCDVVVVGAGPAGAAAALGALREDPTLRVLLLDRSDFPRDKSCGDGIAPHVIDVLAGIGVTGLVDDAVPVPRLRLQRGDLTADRLMERPAYVVPRSVFDARLVAAACEAGALLRRVHVRGLTPTGARVRVDAPSAPRALEATVVVGADGTPSVVRRSLGLAAGRCAVAIRGYAPTSAGRAGSQVIAFGTGERPSYAWSFDRGDGMANVGYGEFLSDRCARPTRVGLLAALAALLPGAGDGGGEWRGHQLPLSSWRPLRPGRGRVLLAGDAAGLVNPMTGEGIYYAVVTGLLAGRAAAQAVRSGTPPAPAYTRRLRGLLGSHLRHTALAAALCRSGAVLDAGIAAAGADQRVFDDLVELGLAQGRLTPRLTGALTLAASGRARPFGRAQSDAAFLNARWEENRCGS